METKHNYFKNYRTIIGRGSEINPKDLKANGIYAVAYKEDGNPETQWGIIVLEDHKIKYCYNVIAKDAWIGFPIEEQIQIEVHVFKATKQECDHADYYMATENLDVINKRLHEQYLEAWNTVYDYEHSTWHKIAASLRKFFSA